MNEVWTIDRVVRWAADDFRARGVENPRFEAELLLAHALDIPRMRIILDSVRVLLPDELAHFRAIVKRRRSGEPVAYIRGYKEFYGRTFRVDRRALIPRPDTETLVEVGLRRGVARSLSARILDLCTGSGCVAITLAREWPTVQLDAVDQSEAAVELAKENSIRLGAAFQVRWLVGDLFAPLQRGSDRYDIILANPPYICEAEIGGLQPEIRDFEPRLALVGGADGLSVVRRIVADAPSFLVSGGVLAVEVGAGQAQAVAALFREAGLDVVECTRDYGGHERVVSGLRA
jgi:release factor glutamine methyltransferase